MSELTAYAVLGFRHITDRGGLDHVLFLIALVAVYRWRQWRPLVWVATAFTIGHSVTLALAVTGLLTVPSDWIEFLIPITIVATGVENIVIARRPDSAAGLARHRPIFAGVFGLVHGAGFAGYLQSMFADSVAVPLLGFNLGLEAGQLLVLALAVGALTVIDSAVSRLPASLTRGSALQMRTIGVSSLVLVIAAGWALERAPW